MIKVSFIPIAFQPHFSNKLRKKAIKLIMVAARGGRTYICRQIAAPIYQNEMWGLLV